MRKFLEKNKIYIDTISTLVSLCMTVFVGLIAYYTLEYTFRPAVTVDKIIDTMVVFKNSGQTDTKFKPNIIIKRGNEIIFSSSQNDPVRCLRSGRKQGLPLKFDLSGINKRGELKAYIWFAYNGFMPFRKYRFDEYYAYDPKGTDICQWYVIDRNEW